MAATVMAALTLAVALAGCGHSSRPNGPTVTKDEMHTKIIATTRNLVQLTGIRLTGKVDLGYGSCTDNNGGPFQAIITSSFVGKPTLSESEAQVDAWVAVLRKHGWSAPQRISAQRPLSWPRSAVPTRCGPATSVVVRKSITAAATASGSWSVNARRAGGVRTRPAG